MKHCDLGRVISDERCKELTDEILSEVGRRMELETPNPEINTAIGGDTPLMWDLLMDLQDLVSKTVGKKVSYHHPYCKIFKNGSKLFEHNDAQYLDWAVSVNVFSNLKNDYPLRVRNEDGSITDYPMEVGHASLVKGNELRHWRDTLVCGEEEYAIQIFLFYTEKK